MSILLEGGLVVRRSSKLDQHNQADANSASEQAADGTGTGATGHDGRVQPAEGAIVSLAGERDEDRRIHGQAGDVFGGQ